MARNTATHELPTSEWEHSHAVEEGDTLIDTQYGDGPFEVVKVNDNGSVVLRNVGDEHYGENICYSERDINGALADGNFERKSDGLSHELATF